jgi:hypothetical protein
MRIWYPAAAAAALLAGCPSYDARVVVPESTKEVNKVVAAGKPKPVDILFVVDNSASMADEQEKLARNFRAFIEVLSQNKDNDYRLAVVTTDAGGDPGDNGNGPEDSGLVDNRFGPAPYFASAGQVRSACSELRDIEHSCFRGPNPMKIIDSSLAPEQQISLFAQTVQVGSCGTGNEQGLLAMQSALSKNCNSGFVRSGANLVVVIVSDEEDSSPARDYVQALLAASGKGASEVRLAAIVGSVDGRAAWCGKGGSATCGESVCNAGRPADPQIAQFWDIERDACKWCSYFNANDCCPAKPGGRYVDFANALEEVVRAADPSIQNVDCRGTTGQKVACLIDSICQDDFSETLRRIARDLVVSNEFGLDPAAKYPPGVVVEVNGERLVNCNAIPTPTPCDFTVTPDGKTVSITNGEKVPGEDDEVEIFFIVAE